MSPEIEVVEVSSLPYRGTFKGVEGFKDLVGEILEFWEELSFDVSQLTANEEVAMAYGEVSGTVKSTGKKISVPTTEVWFFDQGKVSRIVPIYGDTAAVQEAAISS